jgi:hypothetical protein
MLNASTFVQYYICKLSNISSNNSIFVDKGGFILIWRQFVSELKCKVLNAQANFLTAVTKLAAEYINIFCFSLGYITRDLMVRC